ERPDQEATLARTVVPTLRAGHPETAAFVGALSRLHVTGAPIDWTAAFAESSAKRVDLPTYAFERQRFWIDEDRAHRAPTAIGGASTTDHPLIDAVVDLAEGTGLVLAGHISPDDHPWLDDYAIEDGFLVPATVLLDLTLEAARLTG